MTNRLKIVLLFSVNNNAIIIICSDRAYVEWYTQRVQTYSIHLWSHLQNLTYCPTIPRTYIESSYKDHEHCKLSPVVWPLELCFRYLWRNFSDKSGTIRRVVGGPSFTRRHGPAYARLIIRSLILIAPDPPRGAINQRRLTTTRLFDFCWAEGCDSQSEQWTIGRLCLGDPAMACSRPSPSTGTTMGAIPVHAHPESPLSAIKPTSTPLYAYNPPFFAQKRKYLFQTYTLIYLRF